MAVPKLRFRDENGKGFPEWKIIRLGDYLTSFNSRVPANTDIPIYTSSRKGLKPQIDYFDNRELANDGEYGVVPKGYITYRHMSDDSIFKFNENTSDHDIAVSKEYPVFTTSGMNLKFVLTMLNESDGFKKFAIEQKAGGTRVRLYFKNLCEWNNAFFPHIEEQTKIANFLSAVDERIQQINQIYELLNQYKKGVMQKIFSQELRFKDENGEAFGEWEYIFAAKLFKNSTNKKHNGDLPILAVTQDKGVISRDDIEIDIKSTQASIDSYKIIDKGDFVISLRSFQGGIEYSSLHGICSPAYTILKPSLPICDEFYRFYLKKESFIEELSMTVVGIRDGKQISYKAFSTLLLPYPTLPEQTKIANFLSAIDDKINKTKSQLTALLEYKRGLLQQLFI